MKRVIKQIVFSTIFISLNTFSLHAESTEDLKQLIMELQTKVDRYEKRDQDKTLTENMDDLSETVSGLEERLDYIEKRSVTDKLQLGLGARIEVNNIKTTYADGTKAAEEDPVWRTRLYINLKAYLTDDLKFTGRLSSYKNWGDSNTDTSAYANVDSRQGRVPDNSSALYVERAYFDYKINPESTIPIVMTLGRQPSSDGPSYQIKEGISRKGTYDALVFDGAADGIVFTANLNRYITNTRARIAYGLGANTSNNNSATSKVKDTHVAGVFIDSSFNHFGSDNLLQLYGVRAENINGDASGSAGANDVNVGDLNIFGAMFEVTNVAHFDFFAHYAYSVVDPNGAYLPYDVNQDGTVASGEGLGLLTTNGMESYRKKSAHAFWIGTRYELTNRWAVGAEYNKGSQNWLSFTMAPSDPLNKLAARGDATEVYITRQLNKYANLRLGYLKILYAYTGSGSYLGTPVSMGNPQASSSIKEKNNLYLNFNVTY